MRPVTICFSTEIEMNNPVDALLAERSPHKLAGLYARREAARKARRDIVTEGGLDARQVRVLDPDRLADDADALFRRVEPEGERVFQTLLRTHAVLGIAGALVGAIVFLIAWASGSLMAQAAPVAGLAAFTFLAATAGMLLAGLISLRPDQSLLASRLQDRLRRGQWAVIAHPVDEAQSSAANRVFRRSARDTMRTL